MRKSNKPSIPIVLTVDYILENEYAVSDSIDREILKN